LKTVLQFISTVTSLRTDGALPEDLCCQVRYCGRKTKILEIRVSLLKQGVVYNG